MSDLTDKINAKLNRKRDPIKHYPVSDNEDAEVPDFKLFALMGLITKEQAANYHARLVQLEGDNNAK